MWKLFVLKVRLSHACFPSLSLPPTQISFTFAQAMCSTLFETLIFLYKPSGLCTLGLCAFLQTLFLQTVIKTYLHGPWEKRQVKPGKKGGKITSVYPSDTNKKKKNTGKTIYNIKRKQNDFLIDFSFASSEAKHLLLPC